jgi:hypothetical protein
VSEQSLLSLISWDFLTFEAVGLVAVEALGVCVAVSCEFRK